MAYQTLLSKKLVPHTMTSERPPITSQICIQIFLKVANDPSDSDEVDKPKPLEENCKKFNSCILVI